MAATVNAHICNETEGHMFPRAPALVEGGGSAPPQSSSPPPPPEVAWSVDTQIVPSVQLVQLLQADAADATGAAAATVDAFTASTSFGTIAAAITGDAGIISMTSFAKVV